MSATDRMTGADLEAYREIRGMTRQEFADALGYSYSHTVNMMNGTYPVSTSCLERIARMEHEATIDKAKTTAFDQGYQLGHEKGAKASSSESGAKAIAWFVCGVAFGTIGMMMAVLP